MMEYYTAIRNDGLDVYWLKQKDIYNVLHEFFEEQVIKHYKY